MQRASSLGTLKAEKVAGIIRNMGQHRLDHRFVAPLCCNAYCAIPLTVVILPFCLPAVDNLLYPLNIACCAGPRKLARG